MKRCTRPPGYYGYRLLVNGLRLHCNCSGWRLRVVRLQGNTLLVCAAGGCGRPQVAIGSKPCLNVTKLSSTSLVCVTDAPNATSDTGTLLPLLVFQPGRGYAAAAQQYLLQQGLAVYPAWSSPTSWPGRLLPQAGDNVTIPPGQTLLLDVSPPPLGQVTIQGTLVFDYSQPALNLTAKAIFVDANGNLTVSGPGGSPYPSNARAQITLLGLPPDWDPAIAAAGGYTAASERPMLDKALALRQGSVTLTGALRSPTFSVLNATAAVGATSVVVNGLLSGWTVRVVEAELGGSSSALGAKHPICQ